MSGEPSDAYTACHVGVLCGTKAGEVLSVAGTARACLHPQVVQTSSSRGSGRLLQQKNNTRGELGLAGVF